jgi:branched-subunit amino acid transport protein AzlD
VKTEDVRPPQFAQSVGLIFAVVGVAGSLAGIPAIFTIATAFALAAAFLNAAFNFCLGCEMYLLLVRVRKA